MQRTCTSNMTVRSRRRTKALAFSFAALAWLGLYVPLCASLMQLGSEGHQGIPCPLEVAPSASPAVACCCDLAPPCASKKDSAPDDDGVDLATANVAGILPTFAAPAPHRVDPGGLGPPLFLLHQRFLE